MRLPEEKYHNRQESPQMFTVIFGLGLYLPQSDMTPTEPQKCGLLPEKRRSA